MNRGIIPGLNPDGWRDYKPRLLCAGPGGETQPVLDVIDGHSYQFGRYNIVDPNLIAIEVQLAFVGTFSVGAGAAYVISLPFPADRWWGSRTSAPIPLGLGMSYLSFSPSPNVNTPMVVTLADPFASLPDPDNYVQCYCSEILSWGTAALVAADNVTVNHQAGYSPRTEDLDVNATSIPLTTVLTDDFNRADAGTLGAAWTNTLGSVSIVSNRANSVTNGTACRARHDTTLGSTDHWAQSTYRGTDTGNQAGLAVRFDAAADTFYYCSFRHAGQTTRIIKTVAGATTVLATTSPAGIVTGDVLWFGVQGTHLVGKINGKVVIEVDDSALTTGTRAGITMTALANGAQHDDFSAGTFLTDLWPLRIQPAGGTSFKIYTRNPCTANFAWKLRGKPPQAAGAHGGPLLSPTTPWDWNRCTFLGPFGNIFIQALYKPRR